MGGIGGEASVTFALVLSALGVRCYGYGGVFEVLDSDDVLIAMLIRGRI